MPAASSSAPPKVRVQVSAEGRYIADAAKLIVSASLMFDFESHALPLQTSAALIRWPSGPARD